MRLAIVALCATVGCAIADGLGGEAEIDPPDSSPSGDPACESDADCSPFEVCSKEDCISSSSFESALCTDQGDCIGVNTLSVNCPGTDAQCSCAGRRCIFDTQSSCASTSECPPAHYCGVSGRCIRPYDCANHDDCASGVCTLDEGCAGRLNADTCFEFSPCSEGECLGTKCMQATGASCQSVSDCNAFEYCTFDGRCVEPVVTD